MYEPFVPPIGLQANEGETISTSKYYDSIYKLFVNTSQTKRFQGRMYL